MPGVSDRSLAQQRHCPGACSFAGVGVTVAVLPRHAAEQVAASCARLHPAMIELDVANENPVRIADHRLRPHAGDDVIERHGTAHGWEVLADPAEVTGEMSKRRRA
jgi:hypothetical protein